MRAIDKDSKAAAWPADRRYGGRARVCPPHALEVATASYRTVRGRSWPVASSMRARFCGPMIGATGLKNGRALRPGLRHYTGCSLVISIAAPKAGHPLRGAQEVLRQQLSTRGLYIPSTSRELNPS